MAPRNHPVLAALLAALAAACGLDDGDRDRDAAAAPGFATLHAEILAPVCASLCHREVADPPSGFHDLVLVDPTEAYQRLVGVDSPRYAGAVRVVPGDPAASLLWQKVTIGVVVDGFKMPPDCFTADCGLPDDASQRIAAWIEAGALP